MELQQQLARGKPKTAYVMSRCPPSHSQTIVRSPAYRNEDNLQENHLVTAQPKKEGPS